MTTTAPWPITRVRERFPALQRQTRSGHRQVFLDGPGGTQVPQSVSAAMVRYLHESNSNIEGEFEPSAATDRLIATAREYAGAFVGGQADCITFGQNMTTLNFNLIRALGRTLAAGDEIITTELDHEGNVSPWLLLAADRDLVVRTVRVRDDLTLDMDDLDAKLSDRTRVVAFTLASNAVGTLTPAGEIARRAHEVGALAWADAVAYAPHRRINVTALGCDAVLCSPYKFFGPHLGMSWLRPDLAENLPAERVRPASNKPAGHRFETGTLSHEALAGFVAAIEYLADPAGEHAAGGQNGGHDGGYDAQTVAAALDRTYQASQAWETALAEHFLAAVADIPGVRVAGPQTADADLRVGTFGLILDELDVTRTARALGELGIYTWNGDFYATGVVEHLGLQDRGGLLRAGIVHYNTTEDVDRFADALAALS